MRIHHQNMPCEPKVQHIHIHLMEPILNICLLCHGHIASVNQLRQNREGQWLGCVVAGSQKGEGQSGMEDGSWQELWRSGRLEFSTACLKTSMHMVMTMQCVAKDSWSGRQVWRCPSTLTTKLVQWQSLAAK